MLICRFYGHFPAFRPWQYAQEDLDKHPLGNVSAPAHPLPPTDVPAVAMHFSDEAVHDSPWQPVSPNVSRAARRAYRAAVTGMDRKLGARASTSFCTVSHAFSSPPHAPCGVLLFLAAMRVEC